MRAEHPKTLLILTRGGVNPPSSYHGTPKVEGNYKRKINAARGRRQKLRGGDTLQDNSKSKGYSLKIFRAQKKVELVHQNVN